MGEFSMSSLTKIKQEVQGKSKGIFIYFIIGVAYSFTLTYDRQYFSEQVSFLSP